jgi:hypothetical protein
MLRQPDPRLRSLVAVGAVGGALLGHRGEPILLQALYDAVEPGHVLVGEALAHPAAEVPQVYPPSPRRGVLAQLGEDPAAIVAVRLLVTVARFFLRAAR